MLIFVRFGRSTKRPSLPPATLAPMPRRRTFRSQLYRAARDLGNAQAAARGPSALGKRVVRRGVYRTTNRWTRRFLRGFGL